MTLPRQGRTRPARKLLVGAVVLLGLAAVPFWAVLQQAGREEARPPVSDLTYALQADPGRREAVLVLRNRGRRALTLDYRDGQAFDAVVRRGHREVWRWSEAKMFTMMVWSRTLRPAESLEHRFELPPLEPGSYVLEAYSVAVNVSLPPARTGLEVR